MGKALLKGHKTALSAMEFGSFLTTGTERMQQCVRVGLYFKQIVPFLVSAGEAQCKRPVVTPCTECE